MSELALAAVLAVTILLAITISVELGLSVALIELAAGVLVGNAIAQRAFQPSPVGVESRRAVR